MDKPPCSLDELFSFDGLKKYLEYFDKKDRSHLREMNDIKLRLREVDAVNRDLIEVNKKLENMVMKNEIVNETLKSHQNKLLELDSKSNTSEKVTNFINF